VEFDAAKRDLMPYVEPFEDARWAVDFFASRGLRQFVCSSTQEDLVREALEQNGFATSLEAYSGFRPGFDKGRQLRRLIRQHGLRPETTLFVGDSLRDGTFARRARTRFMGLTRSFTDVEFRRVGAESVSDLRVLAQQWESAVNCVVSLGEEPALMERTPTRIAQLRDIPADVGAPLVVPQLVDQIAATSQDEQLTRCTR